MAAAIDGIVLFDGIAYEIQRLLGKGKGGYSYLARRASALYVVKQIHHEPCSYYQFGNKLDSELRDYALLRDVGIPMPELLAVDRSNERLLKEYIPGETVFSLVQREALPDRCLDQVRGMCDLLYPAGLNIDYFSTNFVPSAGTLYYVDYECNAYEEQWDFEHWGIRYWSKTDEFCKYAAQLPFDDAQSVQVEPSKETTALQKEDHAPC